MKSGKVTMGYKSTLKTLRQGKCKPGSCLNLCCLNLCCRWGQRTDRAAPFAAQLSSC
jgi:hypothetical protein